MRDLVDRIDAFQRRHPVVGFPLAVVYKYFDDQGPYLAAVVTYYAFIAIFPLLLIASSVLGFVLEGDEELQQQLLDTALSQFPIVGSQLGRPEGLTGSTTAVVIGGVAALYGVLGLGQAAQNALNVTWAVPRNSRLNPIVSRWRSLLMLTFAGTVVLALTAASSVVNNLDAFGVRPGRWVQWGTTLLTIVITAVLLSMMMRFTTTRRPAFRTSLPGGVMIAVMWHLLQVGGAAYVTGVIATASEMNAVFALVLGLFAYLFVASSMAVLGLEINVVWQAKLFPRALLTPFTDNVRLTEADRRAYGSYAKMQRHKGFQRVDVHFVDVDVDGDGVPDALDTEQGRPRAGSDSEDPPAAHLGSSSPPAPGRPTSE